MTVTIDPTGGLGQEEMLRRVTTLANQAVTELLSIPDATISLINQSENSTYLVEWEAEEKCILRVHRTGYHSLKAIESELAWTRALREDAGVQTPPVIPTDNGRSVNHLTTPELPDGRYCVFFEFLEGKEPAEDDLLPAFPGLGEVTARMHEHVRGWQLPTGFERFTWNLDTAFGETPHWGHWQDAPGITPEIRAALERLLATISKHLHEYGYDKTRFGLAHCDMRLANLLIDGDQTRVIDFDDCGFSWYLYDMATALTFTEDRPDVPALIDAWVEGYRRVCPLSQEDVDIIPSLIMYRRLLALAWVGSHSETELAQSLADTFAPVTAELAEQYLTQFS